MKYNPNLGRFILFTLIFALIWDTVNSLLGTGWLSAAAISFGMDAVFVFYATRHRDFLLTRFLILAFVAGWVELFADYYLVHTTGTLVYSPHGPFVLASPLYMPFAWTVVIVQLIFIGWWVSNRYNLITGSIFSALLAGSNIPYYEWVAKNADWWFYQKTPMLGGVVPLYIIIGEVLIGLSLPFLAFRAEKSHWSMSVVIGIVLGLWIWASYFIAFSITG